MNHKVKIIFLSLTIVVPFLIYCIVYYTPIINNAPFKYAEFVSMEVKWGLGNNLENSYNSATGEYHYMNPKDSLIKKTVKLRKNDIVYLHSKANELGFWNLPDTIKNAGTNAKTDSGLRYVMTMNYKRKSKTVVFFANYNIVPKLRDVAEQSKKLLLNTVNTAEERYGR